MEELRMLASEDAADRRPRREDSSLAALLAHHGEPWRRFWFRSASLYMMLRLVVVTEGTGISLVYASTPRPNAQLTSQKLN